MKFLIMDFSRIPCYLVSLGPEYLFQHPNLNHSPSIFLSQSERPSFLLIQNKRLYCNSDCFDISFLEENSNTKMLDPVVTYIPREQPPS